VEELVRLPGCFLCYTPPPDAPPVAPLPAAGRGFVTFGSFNALAKITDEVLALWARVLAAVPRSRLVLKNKPFACPQARALWMARLAALGVEAWRVDLLPLAHSNADHLAQYGLLDVSLDPFPYAGEAGRRGGRGGTRVQWLPETAQPGCIGPLQRARRSCRLAHAPPNPLRPPPAPAGTTTTVESLFMGVPVVSLRGGCHAHNVGASLLRAVGLHGEWAVASGDAYVAAAAAAAADLPRLAALRACMRERVLASPLCDAAGFVAGVERAYADLYDTWHAAAAAGSAGSGAGEAAAEADTVVRAEASASATATAAPTPLASATTGGSSSDSGGEGEAEGGSGSGGARSAGGSGRSSARSSRARASLSRGSSGCSDRGGSMERDAAAAACADAGRQQQQQQREPLSEQQQREPLSEQQPPQQQHPPLPPPRHGVKRASDAE
jgi:protein O-GlcNAc transferase